jgi:hypothetical protein
MPAMHALTAGTLVAIALAASPAGAATGGPGCRRSLPVVGHHGGGQVVERSSLPVACAVETGYASSESTIAVAGDGALVYSPAQTENSVARSLDDGASWSLSYPADEQPTSFWNTVDPHLVADRRTGRVFWAHATGPVRNEGGLPQGLGFYLAAAYGFQVYTSRDAGRSWTTADYQTAPTGDWEKLAVGPAPPHAAQPAGYPGVVYLCANSPFEVSGPGRLCYRSLDGGATFAIAGYASPSPSNPADICPPLNFGAPVVDGAGALYQPVTCEQAAYVVVSRDEGATYSWLKVPAAPTGSPTSGPYLQLAADDAGTLYALWPAAGVLRLALSRDHGRTWGAAKVVSAPGVSGVARPAFAAGAPGNVGITYYASRDAGAKALSAYLTQTRDALDADPIFYSAALNDPAQPVYTDGGLSGGSPRTDFVGGAYDGAGTTFWAGVVKQLGPPDADGHIATTGYVGRLAFASSAKRQARRAR